MSVYDGADGTARGRFLEDPDANRALDDLRHGRLSGAAVLIP
jgi:hypothetical protein